MKKGKYENKAVPACKSASVRSLALLLALVLLLGGVIGGTIAWLADKSDDVVNTFTTSDITIELKETTTEYKMIPGWTIDKDPKATVVAGSEDCYLFVKIEESENFKDFMSYEIADGWTKLADGVYYMIFDSKSTDENKPVMGTAYSILKGDKVTVNSDVTKEAMNKLTDEPTLTFTAYAVQLYSSNNTKFEPAAAWAEAPKS